MKIAFITPMFVSQPIGGLQIRFYQFQRLLERIASGRLVIWDLRDSKPVDPRDPPLTDNGRTELQAFHPSLRARDMLRDTVVLARHAWPSFVAQSLIEQQNRILTWIDQEKPKHVVLVHPYATELLPYLRLRGMQVFVDCHNVESDLARQLAFLTPPGRGKLHALVRWRVFERRERHYLPFANEVWVPSEINAARLRQMYPGNVRVRCVPNALDIAQYETQSEESLSVTHDMVFPAEFGYPPNVLAAEILCRQVLLPVRKLFPDARLILVGRDQRGWAKKFEHEPDVIVTGEVPDTRPYLYEASIVPVPILQGSGTRFKILEALALERAVVTTPLGCEGLDVQDGKHLLIREINQFAPAIISLLRNPLERQTLGRNGRELVKAKYSLEAVEGIVREAFYSVAM